MVVECGSGLDMEEGNASVALDMDIVPWGGQVMETGRFW